MQTFVMEIFARKTITLEVESSNTIVNVSTCSHILICFTLVDCVTFLDR